MGLYDSIISFVNAIKSTREFNELIQSKSIIEKNSMLKSEINEYSRKVRGIYSSGRSESEIKAKLSELNRQYDSLFKLPEVDRYTKASMSFNEMMFKAYQSINEYLETELKFK